MCLGFEPSLRAGGEGGGGGANQGLTLLKQNKSYTF